MVHVKLEEALVYAVASADIPGIIKDAAVGVVGGFAAYIHAEDADFRTHHEETDVLHEFCLGHDALIPVGVKYFARENVLVDGNVDRKTDAFEERWYVAVGAATQDVVFGEAVEADIEERILKILAGPDIFLHARMTVGYRRGRHTFLRENNFGGERHELCVDDASLGAVWANDEDAATMGVPQKDIAKPGATAHEAREDGFPEVNVMVIDDEDEIFGDFLAPETCEVMVVAIIEEVNAAGRKLGDTATNLGDGGIVAEAVGAGQRGEIKDVRSGGRACRGLKRR